MKLKINTMEKTIEDILEEARERTIRINEQNREEQNQRNRLRNIQEAQKIIADWEKEFKRIRKRKVKISICREYNSHFERFYYKLRCFLDGELYGIFNIDENAGLLLTTNLECNSMGGMDFFTIFLKNKLERKDEYGS